MVDMWISQSMDGQYNSTLRFGTPGPACGSMGLRAGGSGPGLSGAGTSGAGATCCALQAASASSTQALKGKKKGKLSETT